MRIITTAFICITSCLCSTAQGSACLQAYDVGTPPVVTAPVASEVEPVKEVINIERKEVTHSYPSMTMGSDSLMGLIILYKWYKGTLPESQIIEKPMD